MDRSSSCRDIRVAAVDGACRKFRWGTWLPAWGGKVSKLGRIMFSAWERHATATKTPGCRIISANVVNATTLQLNKKIFPANDVLSVNEAHGVRDFVVCFLSSSMYLGFLLNDQLFGRLSNYHSQK